MNVYYNFKLYSFSCTYFIISKNVMLIADYKQNIIYYLQISQNIIIVIYIII